MKAAILLPLTDIVILMHHRNGHIVNYVNATQFATQMFGGLENLYKHTHTHTHTHN